MGTSHHGPLRATEQGAAENMQRLAAAMDEGPDAIVRLIEKLQAAPVCQKIWVHNPGLFW